MRNLKIESRYQFGLRHVLLVFATLVLSACGGGGGGGASAPPPVVVTPPAPKLLIGFDSEVEALEAFRSALGQATVTQEAIAAVDAPAKVGDQQSFSTTYTLEPEVDELDMVKYDGRLLYIAPSRSGGCCVEPLPAIADVAIDAMVMPPPPASRALRILLADADTASLTEAATIELSEGLAVEGLFTEEGVVTVLSSSSWWGFRGWSDVAISDWANQTVSLETYDLSDLQTPVRTGRLEIEGSYVLSRKIGSAIEVVSRFTPALEGYNYSPQTAEDEAANQAVLEQLTASDLLPRIRFEQQDLDLLDLSSCWRINPEHPWATTVEVSATVTVVTRVDPLNSEPLSARCYFGDAAGVYFTTDRLYFVQQDSEVDMQRTLLHQFELDSDLTYSGSGRVDGNLHLGGQRDFRVNAYQETLRLVTTTWVDDPSDRLDHRLWILSTNAVDGELAVLGQLPNNAEPTDIGKPNEDLYGVRFMGAQAYLVTFERIDPLYILDLSDPRSPKLAGSLEIEGFSNFLHQVSDSLLLGVGRDADNWPKVALFDITNPALPESLGETRLGSDLDWAYSPAEYDRRAFTYLKDSDDAARFALPVSGTQLIDGLYESIERLYLFEISGLQASAATRLRQPGFIESSPNDQGASSEPMRSVIDGDSVFFVTGESAYGAAWRSPETQTGPH